MSKINWGRVFLGGLVAGVVINAFEFVISGMLLAPQWEEAMKALGREMPSGAIGLFVLSGFLTGIAIIWLYAAARPRFGPGPKTAGLTGFAYGVIGCALPAVGWGAMGFFPIGLTVISTVAAMAEIVVASVVGAWLYKE